MALKFLNFDPLTKLLTTTAFEDGKNVVKYEQDVSQIFDKTAELRAAGGLWDHGMKQSIVRAAHVPDIVILDMKTRFGVDFYDKSQRKRVLELIETEYPKCKLVDKRLA